jgi:hypothetical protein
LAKYVADLCDGIKEYRNRVHPGRVLSGEVRPDMAQAKLAADTADVVCGQVMAKALQRPEWAADAVLALAESSTLGGGTELATRVDALADSQLRRLLLDLIPAATDCFDSATFNALLGYEQCFACALSRAPDGLRTAVARELLSRLDPAVAPPGERKTEIIRTLVSPRLLDYLDDGERYDLLGHMLGEAPSLWSLRPQKDGWAPPNWDGIGRYLDCEQAEVFIEGLVPVVGSAFIGMDAEAAVQAEYRLCQPIRNASFFALLTKSSSNRRRMETWILPLDSWT